MHRRRCVLVVSRLPLAECPEALWYQRNGCRVLMAQNAVEADRLLRGVRVDAVVHLSGTPEEETLDLDARTVLEAEKRLRAQLRGCLERLHAMREALGSDADQRRAFEAEFSRYLSMAARSRQRIRRLGARVLGTAGPALASGDQPR